MHRDCDALGKPAPACNNLLAAGFARGAKSNLPKGESHFGAWNGPAYVLTDNRTFSAAEMFAATMKDNGIAKTLGARTGGDGCGFMAKGDPLVLAHSQLRFRVPNCLRLRADGPHEVAGVDAGFPLAPMKARAAADAPRAPWI
jgi:hypothetical protein